MIIQRDRIELISAPSILGLRPSGVEYLGASLLAAGLGGRLGVKRSVREVDTLNASYDAKRDVETNCLNPKQIRDFSISLGKTVKAVVSEGCLPIVLGGDCSILIGIMQALKAIGSYGLFFLDAHADFYEPERSVTGEVADMDLAIVTGRGPLILTNINNQQPYVKDENVIHIGQRDIEEAEKYGSRNIRTTGITCFSMAEIERQGIEKVTTAAISYAHTLSIDSFWIHFDTDVLSDEINPAVDYRLPGGLMFSEVEYLLNHLLGSTNIAGISITIFNPRLDRGGKIAGNLVKTIGRAFDNDAIFLRP